MSEANKALVRRLHAEVFNKGDVSVVDELYAPDFIAHGSALAPPVRGLESVKRSVAFFHAAFPDIHYTVEVILAEGDKVATRFTFRGTHQGEFLGVAPTGKQIQETGIDIFRIVDGKLQECWVNWDALSLLQQLGALPR